MKVAYILVLVFVSVNASLLDRPDKALLAQKSLRRETKQKEFTVWREYPFQAWAKNNSTNEEIGYLYDNRTESGSIRTTEGGSTSFQRVPDEEIPYWVMDLYWDVTKWDLELPSGQWIDGGYWFGYFGNEDSLVLDKYNEDWYRIAHYEYKDFQWYEETKVEIHHLQVPDHLTDLVRGAYLGGGSGEDGTR